MTLKQKRGWIGFSIFFITKRSLILSAYLQYLFEIHDKIKRKPFSNGLVPLKYLQNQERAKGEEFWGGDFVFLLTNPFIYLSHHIMVESNSLNRAFSIYSTMCDCHLYCLSLSCSWMKWQVNPAKKLLAGVWPYLNTAWWPKKEHNIQ